MKGLLYMKGSEVTYGGSYSRRSDPHMGSYNWGVVTFGRGANEEMDIRGESEGKGGHRHEGGGMSLGRGNKHEGEA